MNFSDQSTSTLNWPWADLSLGDRRSWAVVVVMTLVTLAASLVVSHLAREYKNSSEPREAPGVVRPLLPFLADYNPSLLDPDGWGRMGFDLAAGKGLIDEQGRRSAFRGPVVPAIYAGLASLFGPTYSVLQFWQCVFFALAAGVMGLIANAVFGDWRITLLAMLFYLGFIPAHPWFVHIFAEPIYTFLMALFALLWLVSLGRSSAGWYFLAGLAFVLAALARPILYFFLPLVLVFEWKYRGFNRRLAGFGAAFLAGFLLLEVPWIARNFQVTGQFIPTTTASSQVWYGITWHEEANWMGNPYHDPQRFPPAAEGFWELTAQERDKWFRKEAWENFRNHPDEVLLLIPRRALIFAFQMRPRGWIPTAKSIVVGGVLYGLAIAGYLLIGPEKRRRYGPCLWLFLFTLVFHSFLGAEYRYSHPVQPYIFILSAAGLWAIVDRTRHPEGKGKYTPEDSNL